MRYPAVIYDGGKGEILQTVLLTGAAKTHRGKSHISAFRHGVAPSLCIDNR
jgi:hypothetical protein